MLQNLGLNQFRGDIQGWLFHRWEGAQEFLDRRVARMSFRRRLLAGAILLVVTYGLIVTIVGLLLIQPSLLQQAFESGLARTTHAVRQLAPLFTSQSPPRQNTAADRTMHLSPLLTSNHSKTAAISIDHERLGEELDDLLKADDILRCVVYGTDRRPIQGRGAVDFAPEIALDSLMAELPHESKPTNYLICRNGRQQAIVTIRPIFIKAEPGSLDMETKSNGHDNPPPAILAGFLRIDYDLAFVRQQRSKFYRLNFIIMAIFVGVGVALALILSRGLHQPMRRLIEGAQRIGSGDFDHRIDLSGHNELVLLGKSFNRMASHLKLREEELQRSEGLYRHLIQDALDGIFVVDRELRFIEVNETLCRMLGCPREELLKSKLSGVIARMLATEEQISDILARRSFRGELVIQPNSEFVETSSPSNCRLPMRTIDLNAAPITDDLYMGIARDITEKKLYEVELHRAAELRELLLRTMTDGIAVLDRDGYLLISNRALEEILESSQIELMQARFTEFKNGWEIRTLADRSLPLKNNPIHLALHAQQRISDYRLKICKDEREKYLSVNTAPLYDERLQLIGAIVALRDITAAVHSARAREMLQQKMQQTAKLASLGELAAGVAHEINNPMTGIINYAQILYDRPAKDHEEKLLLKGILDESNRVTKIVHNLLTFARQQPQEQTWTSLPEILEASLHLMGHRLRKDGITLICEVPKELPPLKCRSQQIQQVFINLLSNAHHALNERYPGYHENKVLKIVASALQRNGRHFIRTEFYDTGIGMAPEVLPKIFDPFFTTKSRTEGTGLGLSISYGIIKDHHGEIYVESQPGEHTSFIIELPTENGAVREKAVEHDAL